MTASENEQIVTQIAENKSTKEFNSVCERLTPGGYNKS